MRATLEAIQSMRTAQDVADLRGKTVEEIVGKRLATAYREAAASGRIPGGAPVESDAAPVGAATPVEAKKAAPVGAGLAPPAGDAPPASEPEAPATTEEPS